MCEPGFIYCPHKAERDRPATSCESRSEADANRVLRGEMSSRRRDLGGWRVRHLSLGYKKPGR